MCTDVFEGEAVKTVELERLTSEMHFWASRQGRQWAIIILLPLAFSIVRV